MKKPVNLCLVLALGVWACSPPRNVLLSDLNHPRYKYIHDFESKISQEKMRNLKRYYSKAATGILFLDALGNSLAVNNSNSYYYYTNNHTEMPRLVRKVRIVNVSTDTLFADLITDLPVDHEYNCSVKKIILPAKKGLTLVFALNEPYELIYRWTRHATSSESFRFYSNSEKTLRVEREGVNRTRVINDLNTRN